MKQSKNYSLPCGLVLKKPFFISTFLLALGIPSYASADFCSGNGYNGYINIGDTQTQVAQACGQPTTQSTQPKPQTNTAVQYWTYSNQKVITSKDLSNGSTTTELQKTGPMIVVQITGDKVTSISVNGQTVAATSACQNGRPIKNGSPSSDVMLSCGNPSNTTTTSTPTSSTPEQLTVWTYNYGAYRAPMVLQFSADGHLQNISQ
jgi:hypothetical protein